MPLSRLVPDLDQALDELYAADLSDFTATRKRLAGELKDASDAAASAAVAAARKPTAAAWAVNQLARRQRKQIDLLLDAGHRLRQAQAALLQGKGQGQFEGARKSEQRAVSALVKEARGLLERHGSVTQATLDQVAESLRAAAVSDEGRRLLAVGRFVKPFAGASGFETIAELAPRGSTRAARPAAPDLRRAKAELRAAEQRARRLEREASAAEDRVQELRAALAEAADRASELRSRAKDAARELGELQRRRGS